MKKTLDFGDIHYLRPAQKYGEWKRLADWLEGGAPITPAIFKFILAVLRGRKPRPRHRPPDMGVLDRDLEIAAYAVKQKCVLAREGRLGKRWAGKALDLDPKRKKILEGNAEILRKERLEDLKNAPEKLKKARNRGADVVDVQVLDIKTARPERSRRKSMHIQQDHIQQTMERYGFFEPAPVHRAMRKFPRLATEEDADLVLAAAARKQ
jgi:hypothetical protein